jgi:hypothetical protein
LGWAFTVRTDHYSLKFLLDQRLSTILQHTWVSKLFGYDITVEYRPGRLNAAADALSRREEEITTINAISAPTFALFDQLREESASDPQVVALCAKLLTDDAPEGWTVQDDLLLFRGKVFIPDASPLWPQLMPFAHDVGREGIEKTVNRFRASFYNSQAMRRVREYVRGCEVCQRNKTEHLHPVGLLQPLSVPSEVWNDISMDFIEGFPKVGGKSVVLTVVDRFSKLAHFIPLSHPIGGQGVL